MTKFEPFETRKLLAAAIDAGRLLVEGTAGDDKIVLDVHPRFFNVVVVAINNIEYYFSTEAVQTYDIRSGDGNDVISAKFSRKETKYTTIKGGSGDDKIVSNCFGAVIYGGDGNDRITQFEYTRIFGGNGDDYIVSYGGRDIIFGEAGNDVIQGFLGNDYLDGGTGNDTLFGGAEIDTLRGDAGDDHLYGTSASGYGESSGEKDLGFGGPGRDWFYGTRFWKKIDYKKPEDAPFLIVAKNSNSSGATAGMITIDRFGNHAGVAVVGFDFVNDTIETATKGVGFFYDGLNVPSETSTIPESRSQTPSPIDLSQSQIDRMHASNLLIPSSWRLTPVAVRQGNIVWFKLTTKDRDYVDYELGNGGTIAITPNDRLYSNARRTMPCRYLAVKKGTLIVSDNRLINNTSILTTPRTISGTEAIIAGESKAHLVGSQFKKLPPARKGFYGIMVNDGVYWIDSLRNNRFIKL